MPLHDHFRPPLSKVLPWTGFHSRWATEIADRLNLVLPPRYRAIANVQLGGGMVEIDVATLREEGWTGPEAGWSPPAAAGTAVVDFAGLDVFEVQVLYDGDDCQLVAAVELVSRRNKDRPAARRAFAMKCANYLDQGAAVLAVDVVTDRKMDLHAELLGLLNQTSAWHSPTGLYAIAYRARRVNAHTEIDWWPEALAVGQPLPAVPLWIGTDVSVRIDLEETYAATFERLRLPRGGPVLNGR
jgi:hypothetical protein